MRQARSPALDRTSSRCWQPQCSWRGAVVVHSSRHHHRTLSSMPRQCPSRTWILLLLAAALGTRSTLASPDAAAGGSAGGDTQQLRSTDTQQQQQQCSANPDAAAASTACSANDAEPATNVARAVSGKHLHSLLLEDSRNSSLVVLFLLRGDPHSDAMLPVFECMPAFFSSKVQFVTVDYAELSFMTLMSQGLHALPVLQVDANGRKYRYIGKHWLVPMLQFVSSAASLQPLVSLEDVRACTTGRGGGEEACSRVSACARTDGEVTAAELRSQRRGPLFTFSAAFLTLRGLWWLAACWRRRRLQRQTAG